MMIIKKDYINITNSTPWFDLPSFDFDEIRDFLLSLGYEKSYTVCISRSMLTSITRPARSNHLLAIKDVSVLSDVMDKELVSSSETCLTRK